MAVLLQGTGTADINPTMQDVYLEKRFVESLLKKMRCVKLGKKSEISNYEGKVSRWQYFTTPAARAAQTEGAEPTDSTDFTSNTAEATLAEFNGVTKYTRLLLATATRATKAKIADLMAYQAALSYDTVAIAAVDGSTTTQDAGTAMTVDELRKAASTLSTNDALFHPQTPGGQFYAALFSPEAAYDMAGEGSPAWFQVKQEAFHRNLTSPMSGTEESSAVYDVCVKKTTNVQQAASEDLNVVIADESFGYSCLETDPIAPKPIFTDPENNIAASVRNFGFIGWLGYFATVLFDSNRVVVIHSDVS